MNWKYGYPNVECEAHQPAPGYVACEHIVNAGAEAEYVKLASLTDVGQILCGPCYRDPMPVPLDRLILICSHCAMAHGWLTSEQLS